MKKKTVYKLLNADGSPSNGGRGVIYSLPDGRKPGEWMPPIADISLCCRGYHAAEIKHLLNWRGSVLCKAEVRGAVIEADDKLVASEIRLISVVKGWNEKNLRLFAADCADHVLPIFEKKYPEDKRPREAIKAARAFARGEISFEILNKAAYAAAYAAADAAAAAAANSAAARKKEKAWQLTRLKKYLAV